MKIGPLTLSHPVALAPMAGMTDTAFRRLVKRRGGCGLVVTEMVSSEGLVRGIDRTLEYAEYTEEERPVSIQIFGGDPQKMADAAQIVEGMGADIVDINMGCPVPKISKHNAGCSLMRDPAHAADVVAAMVKAVRIPVTVKMRAGWNDASRNAPDLASRIQDAGAAAVTIHGRTAEQSYKGLADWQLVAEVAARLTIPVLGSGDCLEPEQVIDRLGRARSEGEVLGVPSVIPGVISGVLVGRGVLRNPWILSQAADLAAGRARRAVTLAERGQFLLDYIQLLISERVDEANGFRHVAPGTQRGAPGTQRGADEAPAAARGRERWVINKIRALCSWYSKGFDGGSHFRVRVNSCESVAHLRDIIDEFFFADTRMVAVPSAARFVQSV
jgi:tRNA-dihydrouridine synthase B